MMASHISRSRQAARERQPFVSSCFDREADVERCSNRGANNERAPQGPTRDQVSSRHLKSFRKAGMPMPTLETPLMSPEFLPEILQINQL